MEGTVFDGSRSCSGGITRIPPPGSTCMESAGKVPCGKVRGLWTRLSDSTWHAALPRNEVMRASISLCGRIGPSVWREAPCTAGCMGTGGIFSACTIRGISPSSPMVGGVNRGMFVPRSADQSADAPSDGFARSPAVRSSSHVADMAYPSWSASVSSWTEDSPIDSMVSTWPASVFRSATQLVKLLVIR